MPRFSVIVPVHKVQGFLRECFDSALSQSFADIEVIAVDDASPDHSGRIIDEYAARDSRLVPLHHTDNLGVGRSRNDGAERATGDYLLFLDGDDTIAPGSLEALDTRLKQDGDPDILYFDHVRTYWWDTTEKSLFGELLASAGTDVFAITDRPEFLKLFAMTSNRVYRRDFYQDNGFLFDDGIYEDALVSYKTMLTATRISCTDRVCLQYRQRRSGASTRSPGREHFVIFEQYSKLFAFLGGKEHLDALRPQIFERAASHILFCLNNPDRIPLPLRREFLNRAVKWYRAHAPAGFVPTAELRPLAHGGYLRMRLAERYQAAQRNAAKRRRKVRQAWSGWAKSAFYRFQLRRPVDPNLAVYAAYWDRGMLCNPAAIYRKARELAPHIRGVWVVRKSDADRVPAGVEYVIPGTKRYWKAMARAKYLVNNVNFANTVIKRPGTVHVQTHHGTPLKKMGIDQQRYPASTNGMSFRKLLDRVDRWDFSISANPHSSEVWERVYPSSFRQLESGYPRNDVYFTAGAAGVDAARAALGIAPRQTAILYAPTMRDYQKGYVPRIDLARVCRELGPDFVLLTRVHYFHAGDDTIQELHDQGLIIDVSRHPSVEELCLAADALVTDYSSIMFDYANLDRPIVIHADDWPVYRASRGVYFDLLSGTPGETPGPVSTSDAQLIDIFRGGSWRGTRSKELRAAFRTRFCAYDDGRAAERVVRRVFLGEPGLIPVTPLADRTPAPSPAEITGRSLVPAPGEPTDREAVSR
ncbi:bifunctional glycosyltransferase/CDP-glycerol:glycerophosphate glycerophosphotransferase [Actinacidiphila oryziradicis]|uniref:bifunctional glycosyltransferase/CDP-glycerol:glycerophosphate glycerophosphotransferase n=1 Tax=Actinacidiphila oryziradicis TaxID=2571141 RepID=UPI0023F06666|nr:bifunctional glycosyltransferase/CDP-glycerol:glycerophosphate glycerophosphotransferase [Actinacidiphila oryziradicis]MCW2872281.1 glycosyl transferase [Actinacidiphila oryziradicis]